MTAPIAPQQDENRARIARNVDKMLAQGASEAEVEEYIQSEGLQPRQDFSDVERGGSSSADVGLAEGLTRAAGQGLSFGFSDELQGVTAAGGPLGLLTQGGRDRYRTTRDLERGRADAFQQDHPGKALLAEVLGGIPTAMVGGGAAHATKLPALAQALRAARTAGAAGAIAGTGFSEADSPLGVAGDAATGAALGGGLGFGASMLGRGLSTLGGAVRDIHNPHGAVLRQAAKVLPDDAEQIVARQNLEAPGTAVAGDLSPEMLPMAKQLAKDNRVAAQAPAQLRERVSDIGLALEGMGPEYDALNRVLPVEQELQDAMLKLGKQPFAGQDVEFSQLHRMRSDLRKLHRGMQPSMQRHDLGEGLAGLNTWLGKHIPELGPLDERYAFVLGRQKAAGLADKLASRRIAESSAAQAGGGQSRGHPGGFVGMVTDIFRPGVRANEVQETLFNPARTAEMLPQIRAARNQLLAPDPRAPQFIGGTASAAAGAGAGSTAAKLSAFMADQDTQEIRMRQQQQQLMGGMP